MILRKSQIALLVVILSIRVSFADDPPSKTYDNSDWIPIAQPEVPPLPEKKAQARVLNLADPPQKNFFPEENVKPQQQFQQYLRETTIVNPFPVRGQQQQYVSQPQTVAVPVRDQPYRFEIAQLKQVPQKVVEDIQPQYYLQAQPIRQHFSPETQFVMRPIPTTILQQPIEQTVPQLTRPKVQYVVQPQQQYSQQTQQYHTIPQEYLHAPFAPQTEIYDQQYHTIPVPHQIIPYKIKSPANKTKTYIARPIIEQPPPQNQKEENENIQLVYVPLESLKQNNEPIIYQRPQSVSQIAAPKPPPPPPTQRVVSHRQQQIKNIEKDFVKQALDAHKLQMLLLQDPAPVAYTVPIINTLPTYSTTTTTRRPVTRKRKPHQPPLAVYMGGDGGVDVSDVLALLKHAKSIDVQDSFGPHSPQVFVGPSSLQAPNGYAKFELPYLSNIDNNRVERKVDQLPFFVAPLSYKAPSGYSKIPLPSPHVGSVVVSTKANLLHEKVNNIISTPIPRPQSLYDYREYYEEKPTTAFVSSTTSTTPAPKLPSRTSRPHPVSQVVNQYEIDQINNQFTQPAQYTYDSFPISKYQEYDVASREEEYTSPRTTTLHPKPNRTIPPLKYYSPNPTQNTFVDSSDEVTGKYTVFDQYIGNVKSSTPNYEQYYSQEPVQYYATASPQPIYTRSSPRPTPNNQHLLSQDVMDYQILRSPPTEEPQKTRYKTVVIPVTSTERPQSRQTAKPLLRPQVKPGDYYLEDSDVQVSPKYKESNEDQSEYKITEDLSNKPTQSNSNRQYLSEAYYNQGLDPEKIQDYYNLPSLLPPVSQSLPSLINELQDQSIKSLLVPALLAPTTSKNVNYENKEQEYVEVSSIDPPLLRVLEMSTEATLPETTTRTNRGRQRGNRYTTTSSVSSDTTRRNLSRGRRPYTSRTREDSVSSTTEYSNIHSESRKTVPINRSRFRTRGRPTNTEDRSTTPIVEEAASSSLQGNSVNALTSYQIEDQSNQPQVSNIPSVKYEEQYVINNYQPVYNPSNDEASVIEVLRQTPKQQYDEVTEGAKSKVRSRVRSRTRPTTTPAPQTEKSVEDLNEEYGFIRVPNYKKSTEVSNDNRETQKYSSTYVSSTSRPTIQYAEEVATARPKEIRYFIQEQVSPSTPIYFIGEIRPKYQQSSSTSRIYDSNHEIIGSTDRYVPTTPSEYSTEPVTSRVRNRVRIAGRIRDTNDEVTIKPIHTRTRGKSHYKPPQSIINKKTSEEDDVEGGNYPELYLKSKENYTPRPSFQITVDPGEDQVPHSSIYQPKYLPHGPENPGVLNDIPLDTKPSNFYQYTTEPTPTALPYIAFERTEDSADNISTERLVDTTHGALNILQDDTPTQSSISIEDTTHVEEITKTFKKAYGKRRGVWKLVKARPVEVFVGAESQSLSSNKNNIEMNIRPSVHMYQVTEESELNTNAPDSTTNTNPQTTSEESNTITEAQEIQRNENLFDSLYEMFGITQTQEPEVDSIEETNFNNTTEIQTESEKTTTEKVNSENAGEFIITADAEVATTPKEVEKPKETTQDLIIESLTEPQKAEEDIQSTTQQPMSYVTPMSLHMWTSTSTEVSHETEICYKGKCVKSKESK